MSDMGMFRQLTKPRGPLCLVIPLKVAILCLLSAKSTRRNPSLGAPDIC